MNLGEIDHLIIFDFEMGLDQYQYLLRPKRRPSKRTEREAKVNEPKSRAFLHVSDLGLG